MSIFWPPLRRLGKRSITITMAPARENQYAAIGPAMDATMIRTRSCDMMVSPRCAIDPEHSQCRNQVCPLSQHTLTMLSTMILRDAIVHEHAVPSGSKAYFTEIRLL